MYDEVVGVKGGLVRVDGKLDTVLAKQEQAARAPAEVPGSLVPAPPLTVRPSPVRSSRTRPGRASPAFNLGSPSQ